MTVQYPIIPVESGPLAKQGGGPVVAEEVLEPEVVGSGTKSAYRGGSPTIIDVEWEEDVPLGEKLKGFYGAVKEGVYTPLKSTVKSAGSKINGAAQSIKKYLGSIVSGSDYCRPEAELELSGGEPLKRFRYLYVRPLGERGVTDIDGLKELADYAGGDFDTGLVSSKGTSEIYFVACGEFAGSELEGVKEKVQEMDGIVLKENDLLSDLGSYSLPDPLDTYQSGIVAYA